MSEMVGARIVEVRPMTPEEIESEGWDDPATVLVLDSGQKLYASQDPEGNGPGALFGTDELGEGFTL